MAIASAVHARSVVEYSESTVFHYQHSSISQLFIRIRAGETEHVSYFIKSVEAFVLSWLCKVPDFSRHGVICTALDCTPYPQKSKKGNGREQGTQMPPKLRYHVVRKTQKSTKKQKQSLSKKPKIRHFGLLLQQYSIIYNYLL